MGGAFGGAMGGGGGSFLGTAAATAAGMVGGSLLLNSFRGMMGGSRQAFGDTAISGDRSPWSDQSRSDLARDAGVNDIGSKISPRKIVPRISLRTATTTIWLRKIAPRIWLRIATTTARAQDFSIPPRMTMITTTWTSIWMTSAAITTATTPD